jgi:hypothetical protein
VDGLRVAGHGVAWVRSLHGLGPDMESRESKRLDRRQDGFGTRWFDPKGGRIEVLDVTPVLATPQLETSIRARVAYLGGQNPPSLAPVRRMERNAQALSVVTATPVGVPLAELLAATEFGIVDLSDHAAFAVAAALIKAVADLHALPGSPYHGSIGPAHVIVQRDGTVVLTGWAFADALATLEKTREQLWREFCLPMPASASLPTFDHRADVTQMGCLVLSLLMRRVVCGEEFPKKMVDLVGEASLGELALEPTDELLRLWLQHALQMDAKESFDDAVEAAVAFSEIKVSDEAPGGGRQTIDEAVRQLCGELPPRPLLPLGESANDMFAAQST